VRVLLDTHVLVWAATTPERLGADLAVVEDADRRIVSAVCVWELAIKQRLGKLSLGSDVRT
jgi:PIN domain nuclease of toxin-antitoxin system